MHRENLNIRSDIRNATLQELYCDWWQKHGPDAKPQKKKVAEIVDSKLRSISTTIRRVRLKDIRILDNDENARYMTSEQMRVLVDNLKRGGNLTSVPLVIEKEKRLEAVSGNHRIQVKNVYNTAVAIDMMADLALERLAQIEEEHDKAEKTEKEARD